MSDKYQTTKTKLRSASRRWMYCAVAGLVLFAGLLALLPGRANAYAQVSGRSIEMSSTDGGATNVAYQVGFTTVTDNQTVGSVVVEVCGNSPILGDSCTAPAGFNSNYATTNIYNATGNITGLTVDTAHSTINRVVLTRTAGAVANGAVTFTLGNGTTNGFTNPSAMNATFYARIMTFTNTTGAVTGTSAEGDEATDAGGVAISTAQQLHVTAKVQEALMFCVYTGTTCTDGGNDVSLGDENGVLANNSLTYTANASYDVSSNAVHGVSIRLKGDVLKSGIFSIDPAGPSCQVDPTASGTEMFGLRMSTLGPLQVASAPYDCASGSHGFDNNTTTGTASMFGQEIAHTTGASDVSTSQIEFAAKSANTSEAGVYTTTLSLIATATY